MSKNNQLTKTEKKNQKKEALKNATVEERNKRNYKIRRNIVVIILLILAISLGIISRGNYLELKEMGDNYAKLFMRKAAYTCSSLLINFLFIYLVFYFTHNKTQKLLKLFFDDEKKEMPRFPKKSASFIIAVVGSIVATIFLLQKALLAGSNSWFGIKDPVFNIDIGYFIFIKPFIKTFVIYLMIVIISSLVYSLAYALIIINSSFNGVSRETLKKCNIIKVIGPKIKTAALLLGIFLLITMVSNIGNEKFINIELSDGNLYSLYGAGNSDATIKLAGYTILAILATFSLLQTYKAVKENTTRRAVGYILIVPVYLIALAIVLAIYSGITNSNFLEKNEKYIKDNITLTKDAYALNSEYKTIDYSGAINSTEIKENSSIINNMPIVTADKVIEDVKSYQTIKGYYTFRNTQIGLYNIDNVPTLCYITPREIANTNTTYSNKTYQYTHGFGSIVTQSGKTDEQGYLINYNTDFNVTDNTKVTINQPRIYYGLETNDIVVINSTKQEFDYINDATGESVDYNYQGKAGLNLGFFDRLILGITEGDLKLATSVSLKNDSRILTNRNIINRAKTAMPYLTYDDNPYLVVNDAGELYWVLDAYTLSNEFPFSQKYEGPHYQQISYLKNSCKVLINAYDGDMRFFITDRTDPIIMAYNNIYPGLFMDKDTKIPEDISKHFVYPQYLFKIQADLATVYHDIATEVLYRGNDIWEIAQTTGNNTTSREKTVTPYYTMIKDDNGKDTIGIIAPYCAYDKQNIVSYMVGYYQDGNLKTKIVSFHANSNVPGLLQLENQINQDETISAEIASLNVSGTRVSRNVFVIPVENTLLYVETVYQELINETNSEPTLKKVIIASGNKVAIGDTAQEAINNITSKALNIDIINIDDKDALINEIIKANQNVKNSSQNNDWKLYGEDMAKLTSLIDQLSSTVQQEKERISQNAILESQSAETTNEVN